MTNVDTEYSNEMLAAYLDGISTPIEDSIIKDCENNEDIQEVIDITNGYKDINASLEFNHIDIGETIDNFLKPFNDYKELKTSFENKSDLIK